MLPGNGRLSTVRNCTTTPPAPEQGGKGGDLPERRERFCPHCLTATSSWRNLHNSLVAPCPNCGGLLP